MSNNCYKKTHNSLKLFLQKRQNTALPFLNILIAIAHAFLHQLMHKLRLRLVYSKRMHKNLSVILFSYLSVVWVTILLILLNTQELKSCLVQFHALIFEMLYSIYGKKILILKQRSLNNTVYSDFSVCILRFLPYMLSNVAKITT